MKNSNGETDLHYIHILIKSIITTLTNVCFYLFQISPREHFH